MNPSQLGKKRAKLFAKRIESFEIIKLKRKDIELIFGSERILNRQRRQMISLLKQRDVDNRFYKIYVYLLERNIELVDCILLLKRIKILENGKIN